jgi:hypothetical protein
MFIELNAFQLQIGILAAERFCVAKKAQGNDGWKHDRKQSLFSAVVHGVMGELAVASILGVTIDPEIYPNGDGGVDLKYKNATVQVKNNMARGKDLYFYVTEKEQFKSSVGVLTRPVSMTQIQILGWISKESFLLHCQPINFGYRTNYGVNQNQLDEPEFLKSYLDTL